MNTESGTAGLGTSVDEMDGTEGSEEDGLDAPNPGDPDTRIEGASVVASSHPNPSPVPGEFEVKLGVGWGGSLHDLADGLAGFELGARAAVSMMLSWCEFVEIELEGFEDLLEQLRLLRGALVTAGIEAVGTMRDNSTDW